MKQNKTLFKKTSVDKLGLWELVKVKASIQGQRALTKIRSDYTRMRSAGRQRELYSHPCGI